VVLLVELIEIEVGEVEIATEPEQFPHALRPVKCHSAHHEQRQSGRWTVRHFGFRDG
jgi:hypothetical protein